MDERVGGSRRGNPVRTLPAEVNAGDEFQVTVTFTSPTDNFAAIGLADVAPAGWSVTAGRTRCTPDADNNQTSEEADYIWYGPYAAGAGFTAVYKVQVPTGATLGTYNFTDGTLEYYVGSAGHTVVNITGDNQVEVAEEPEPGPVGGTAYPPNKLLMLLPWVVLGVVVIAGIILLVRRRRSGLI